MRLPRPFQFETQDIDEARERVRSAMNRSVDITDHTNFYLSLDAAPLEEITITACELRGGLRIRGYSGAYTLTRVEEGRWDWEGNGRQVTVSPGWGLLTPPGCEYESHTPGSFHGTSLVIPEMGLLGVASKLVGEPVVGRLEIPEAVPLGSHTTMGDAFNYFLDELRKSGGTLGEHPKVSAWIQRGLIAHLIEHTPNSYHELLIRRPGGAARRHVELLESYLEARLTENIKVADMVRHVGVSARTLDDSCQDVRLASPYSLLRNMRFKAARARLENPEWHDTVTSVSALFRIANNFSSKYEALYGESPQGTLRRGREQKGRIDWPEIIPKP